MKLPTMIVPEMTRDVEIDMLVVGTALRVKGDEGNQKQSPLAVKNRTLVVERLKAKTITPTTKSTTTTTLLKSPQPTIAKATIKLRPKESYTSNYTPSKPSCLRTSTISTPLKPPKPHHLLGKPIPLLQPSSISKPLSQLQLTVQKQKRHRIVFSQLHNVMLKNIITLKIQEDIVDRRRAQEARDRRNWELDVLEEADDREMAIGRKRLRMMSVWLDLKGLTTEGGGFVFECGKTGEERDEALWVQDEGYEDDDEDCVDGFDDRREVGDEFELPILEAERWW